MGFCSNLKRVTNFSARNPKTLHFPKPKPLIAKSNNKKIGIPIKFVLM